jgi:hypothetical protein
LTDWTAPKTFASGDVGTAAEMNTYLRDNELHLKERFAGSTFWSVTMDTERTTTSDTVVDVTGTTLAVTVARASDVIVVASFNAKTNDYLFGSYYYLYRDSTYIGLRAVEWRETYQCAGLVAFDDNVAAGTYTYRLKYSRAEAGGGTVYADQVVLSVLVIPTV